MVKGGWIETQDFNKEDRETARLVRFRKLFSMDQIGETHMIRISADTRYRLYINGAFVQYGPSRGDHHVWFYDEIDITPFIKEGQNTIGVLVLHYPEDTHNGNHGMFRFDAPRLWVSGMDLCGWRYSIDRDTVFYAEEEGFAPLHIHEKKFSTDESWKTENYDDSSWKEAKPCFDTTLPDALRSANLKPRTIPFMKRVMHKTGIRKELNTGEECTFVFDAGEEMTAFVRLEFENGAGSEIELLYSECYEYENGKGDRTDSVRGHLNGYRDFITLNDAGKTVYESFWFRTFRYIRFTIRAASPVKLVSFCYEETGYPLEVKTEVSVNGESMKSIYDICLRSLKRCMQETYIDCPFYEQLQYVMDTRAQILYTYSVSADDRLARKAIDDFARAKRPDGLLNCSYPNTTVNVIPCFSLYYIFMIHDHMMYFGDRDLVKTYLPVIRGILSFFHARLNADGLVGKTGGILGKEPFWAFIDWAKEWMETSGMPEAGLYGPVAIESELYVSALKKAAELCDFVSETGGDLYRKEAAAVTRAVRTLCMKDGMISDGPGLSLYSQQAQVFGILSHILDKEEGKKALLKTINDPAITQCTVATSYYLFRAMEETDLYEYTDRYWNIWRQMVNNGCTTCVEGENYPRSECHAWGALALYELPSAVLGVRPGAPGYEKILVHPVPGYLTSAHGTVRTPFGDVSVSWERVEDHLNLSVECDDLIKSRICTK